MRKLMVLCLSMSVMAGAVSCRQAKKKAAKTDEVIESVMEAFTAEHNARNSLDYQGVYSGILPCADCPGIETRVTLGKDTYTLKRKYLERQADVYESSGNYVWDETGFKITLKGEEPNLHFFVGENMLRQLDLNGERITGQLEEHYILKKIEE